MPASPPTPDADELARALREALPPAQQPQAVQLAQTLLSLASGDGPHSTTPADATALSAALQQLAGKTVTAGATAVDFGTGNTFGDVTLRGEFAGGSIVKVTVVTADADYDVAGLPNPYIGLEAFSYDMRDRFGGREQQVSDAVTMLTAPGADQVMLFVTGASGSGKSSFVQAGLLPALEQHYAALGSTARRAVMRPGREPLAALQRALQSLGVIALLPSAEGPDPLGALLAAATSLTQVNLLVLDQFEEAFTQADAPSRAAFFALLSPVGEFAHTRTHLIATMRADYLPNLFEHAALYDIAKQHGIELRGMSRAELSRAIQSPVEAQNAAAGTTKRWQPELVKRLVEDTLAEPTLLPLLQVTLESIWRRGRLTLDRYDTLTDALEEDAETAYLYRPGPPQTARSEAERAEVMDIFLDLVEVSLDDNPQRDVRRSVPKADLILDHPARAQLIDQLVGARLLSVERRGAQQVDTVDTVDIIHETLLRNWNRLSSAIVERREALQQRERFRVAVDEWLEHQRADSYTLGGVQLAEGQALAARNDIALRNPDARAFLTRSVAVAERARRRGLMIAAGVMAVIFVAAIASLYLYFETQRAREQTLTQQARELASSAVAQLPVDPERSLLLSMFAVDRAPPGADAREADAALRLSLLLSYVRASETVHAAVVNSAAFSPDGRRVLTASADGSLSLWRPGDPAAPAVLLVGGERCTVYGAVYSADGQHIASFGDCGLTLWDVVGDAAANPRVPVKSRTNAAAFSPDGHTLVAGLSDKQVDVFDLRGAEQPQVLRAESRVFSVATSAAGLVAAASEDQRVRVWDPRAATTALFDRRFDAAINGLVFSADGSRLVLAGQNGQATLWDAGSLADPAVRPLATWTHDGEVKAAAFSLDGTHVVTGSADRSARIWDVQSGAPVAVLRGHTGDIVSVAFDSTGDRVVTASTDGSARIWDVRGALQLALLSGHAGGLTGAAFSPDGLRVVTSSWDSTARVWDGSVGRAPPVVRTASGVVTATDLSADGRWLLTAGDRDEPRVWDAQTGARVVALGAVGAVRGARFSPDGSLVALGRADGRVTVMNWRDPRTARVLEPDAPAIGAVNAVAFSPDAARIGFAGDGGAAVWDWQTDPSSAVVLGSACGEQRCRHTDVVQSIAFSNDGTRVLTTSRDTTARRWDAASGAPIGSPLKHANQLRSGIFLGSDRIITASNDRTAHVWNVTTGREEPAFFGHAGIVNSLALSGDQRWLVTGSDDSTARVWDAASRETVAILSGHVREVLSAAISTSQPAGSMPRVVTAGKDGSARVYECDVCADLPTLRILADSRVTRQLTTDERRRFLHDDPAAQ